MPVSQQQLRLSLQKLDRQLRKTADDRAPENVHHLRTQARRIEALLDCSVSGPAANHKKLLKLLCRLRKRAGRIRDLDVQIAALTALDTGRDGNGKSQLLRDLAADRDAKQKKLAKRLHRDTLDEVRKRLKRVPATHLELDPLKLAIEQLSQLPADTSRLNEKTLHQYRIVGKRSRYLAELADHDPRAKRLVEALKHMQDVIGDWHDSLKLTESVREGLPASDDSALLARLRRITAEKFGTAVHVLNQTRAEITGLTAISKAPVRKAPTATARAASAA
jgi:CHAD domain-containing protein